MSSRDLNKELRVAYQLALMGGNLLVLGQAGSGKSTLIRALIKHFRHTKDRSCTVLAPTHKAALAIKGDTLASAVHMDRKKANKTGFKILSINNELTDFVTFTLKGNKKSVNVIIIDEFGMVRADQLQGLDAALKNRNNNNAPFGGVQIIAVGDYKQIPPVLTERYEQEYYKNYDNIYNFCAPAFKEANFFPVNATENLRMKKHPDQIRLMEMIRKQENLEYVASEINKIVNIDPYPKDDNLFVTKYNAVVAKINKQRLDALSGKEYNIPRSDFIFNDKFAIRDLEKLVRDMYIPIDKIRYSEPTFDVETAKKSSGKDSQNRKVIEAVAKKASDIDKGSLVGFIIKDDRYDCLPTQDISLQKNLTVKIGAKLIAYHSGLDRNKKKYFNGQTFTLIGSAENKYLVLEDTETKKEFYIERIAMPITINKKVNGDIKYETIGYQIQFPVMLGFAQTYHKTQGMTLRNYILDTRGNDFVTGLTYVGLSRAVDLSLVTVTAPIKPSNLLIDKDVMEFYNKYNCF